MPCPDCGFENPEGFSFCGKCAASLVDNGCQKCGFVKPGKFEYCAR